MAAGNGTSDLSMVGMSRPNPLADPEFAKLVAEAFVDGLSRQQMCDTFGVKDRDTITRWRRDARVKAIASKLIEDRVLQVTRKVDGEISARLENAGNLTVKELIDIRREFLGGQFRKQVEGADAETVAEAMDVLENTPNFMDELERVFQSDSKRD